MRSSHPFVRLVIVLLVTLAFATKAWAAPCSGAREACLLEMGKAAPYTGILMTETMADSLGALPYKIRELESLLVLTRDEAASAAKRDAEVIFKLEKELEDTPGPVYESPWFWLGIVGGVIGGAFLGAELSK